MSVPSFDVTTDGITLTCATPGSGLSIRSGASINNMIVVKSRGVTVERLVLDSRGAIGGAYLTFFDPAEGGFAEDARFLNNRVLCSAGVDPCVFFALNGKPGAIVADNTFQSDGAVTVVQLQGVDGGHVERNIWTGSSVDPLVLLGTRGVQIVENTIICGSDECLFGDGIPGTVVARNRFESGGSGTGVHLQGGIDGVRVENNEIVATAPSTGPNFGAVRVRGGSNVIVAGNVVLGPWANSIAAAALVGSRSRIENNRLEGATHDAIRVFGSESVQIRGNPVHCGRDSCFFADGSPALTVADNHFESAGSLTGVHLQGGIDGSRVERNTIAATAPSTVEVFGGIRVRDGSEVVVADNVIQGPWANGIAAADLDRSEFAANAVEGAAFYGLRMASGDAFRPVSMTDNRVRTNRVSGSGTGGVLVHSGCRNTFVGNNLERNVGNLGAIFDETTGANTFIGNRNVVADEGNFDCNGDGIADPNILTGPGRARTGVNLGQIVSGAAAPPGSKLR